MAMMARTCNGCGGRRLKSVDSQEDWVVKRVGTKVILPKPLPLLCLDCGGTSHTYQPYET